MGYFDSVYLVMILGHSSIDFRAFELSILYILSPFCLVLWNRCLPLVYCDFRCFGAVLMSMRELKENDKLRGFSVRSEGVKDELGGTGIEETCQKKRSKLGKVNLQKPLDRVVQE